MGSAGEMSQEDKQFVFFADQSCKKQNAHFSRGFCVVSPSFQGEGEEKWLLGDRKPSHKERKMGLGDGRCGCGGEEDVMGCQHVCRFLC